MEEIQETTGVNHCSGDQPEWQTHEIECGLREAEAEDFASDDEVAAVFGRWLNLR